MGILVLYTIKGLTKSIISVFWGLCKLQKTAKKNLYFLLHPQLIQQELSTNLNAI
jgi:hypothetical protein